MSRERGGRGARVGTSPERKPGGHEPSGPPSAQALLEAIARERERLRWALRDLLAYFDRAGEHGWTAADVRGLEEIRKAVNGDS